MNREREDFESEKTALFTKAGEFAHEFGVETYALIVSGDGNVVYTTSDVLTIIAKSKGCEPSATRRFTSERGVVQRIDAHVEGQRMFKQALSEVLDKDISGMNVNEVLELEKQLTGTMCSIQKRAVKIRKHQLEQINMLSERRKKANQQTTSYVAETGQAINFVPSSSQSGRTIPSDTANLLLTAWVQNEETPEVETDPHTELIQQKSQANQQITSNVAETGQASNFVPSSSQSGPTIPSDSASLTVTAWVQNAATPEVKSDPHTELVIQEGGQANQQSISYVAESGTAGTSDPADDTGPSLVAETGTAGSAAPTDDSSPSLVAETGTGVSAAPADDSSPSLVAEPGTGGSTARADDSSPSLNAWEQDEEVPEVDSNPPTDLAL